MSNAQHSASTGEWYTPPRWVEAVRRTLGEIGLDPCTSEQANRVVKATVALTHEHNALETRWGKIAKTAFVNPPGSCIKRDGVFTVCGNETRCSCKLPRRFLAKSMIEAYHGVDVVYLAYSVNQLRTLATLLWPPGVRVSVAVPPVRIAYLNPETLEPVRGTNCDSAFFCLSKWDGTHADFAREFQNEGCRVFTV